MNSSSAPLVSVILPIYNAGDYLKPAIESILAQSLQNFELILIDDCSTDGSRAIAQAFTTDPRVILLVNETNRGRAYTDNRGHAQARGSYIAKMDADDIALPQRLQRQYDFLAANPSVGLTSSFLQCFGESDLVYRYPVKNDEVRAFLLFNMPVGNPAVFFRRELLSQYPLQYDEQIADTFGEDYEWVARVAHVAAIENQAEILLRYRTFSVAHKAQVHARRTAKANTIRERLLRQAGFQASERELHIHNTIAHFPFELGDIALEEVHAWLLSLSNQNQQLGYTSVPALHRIAAERWFLTCYHNPDRNLDNYAEFWRRSLSKSYQAGPVLHFKFWLKNKLLRHLSHYTS